MGKILDEIREIAKEKEKAGKKLEMTSFRESRIRNLEKRYKEGDLNKDETIAKLRDEFGHHLEREDYDRIEGAIR